MIAAAAVHVKIKDYSVKLITQKLSPKEELVRKIVGEDVRGFIPKAFIKPYADVAALQQLSPLLKPLMALQKMTNPQGIYASCLECLAP